jgi:PTS system nitrogen regulatory IIA component
MQLTVRDAARLLEVSDKTIFQWIDEGVLPFHRVNEQYRFNRSELLEWATARNMRVSIEIFTDPDAPSRLPGLAEALQRGGIHYHVSGHDRRHLIKGLVDHLPIPDPADREAILNLLTVREEAGSTAIGDGIAIPHVRHPMVLHVARPLVSLCFLDNPVDLGAADGKPVTAVFTVVSPSMRGHLHLLARLAWALHDADFKAAVMTQAPGDELLAKARLVESRLASQESSGQTG